MIKTPTQTQPVPLVAGLLAMFIALLVLLGWWLNNDLLLTFGAAGATMKANTALLMVLAGAALVQRTVARQWAGGVGAVLPALVVLLATLTIAEYAFRVDLGIDQLLVADPYTNPQLSPPGRPSLLTVTCFLLLGGAFFLNNRPRMVLPGQLAVLFVVVLAVAALVGHLAGIREFFAFGNASSIAVHTALGLLALGVGMANLTRGAGLILTATSPYWGGIISRSLGLYLLLVPPLLTYLYHQSVARGLLGPETGFVFVLYLFLFITLLFFYRVANQLNRLGQMNQQTLDELSLLTHRQQQQADFLDSILQSIANGIVSATPIRNDAGTITDFVMTLANKQALATANKTAHDLVGQSLRVLFPNICQTDAFEMYRRAFGTGELQTQEIEYDREGQSVWLTLQARAVGNTLVITWLDVTEQKQNNLAQRQLTDVLTGVVENGKAGITLFDPLHDQSGAVQDFRYVFTNTINSQNIGKSVAEMTGQTLLTVMPFMAGTEWFSRLMLTAATGQSQSFVYDHHADGVHGWFDTLFMKIGNRVLFTDLNVTPLKEAELALQRQNNLLERVMNTTPTAIVVHESIRDETGQIIDFRMVLLNQVAAGLLGNPPDAIQHRRVSQYFPGFSTMPIFNDYQSVAETGRPVRTEVLLANRWYDFSIAQFGDGVIVASQDITPTHQARHQLEQANHDLNRSNDSLRSFAYVASHDLQEPLRKAIAFADILHTQFAGEFSPQATDIIRRIQTSVGRMRTLVQDLLLYSRVESHQEGFVPVSLTALLTELRENELWAAFQQNKAELRVADLPHVLAAPSQMRQLFQNLVGNALKFRRPGVVPLIQISARTVLLANLPAGLLAPAIGQTGKPAASQFHEIAVQDNGIGFEPQYAERIFQVFQRLHGQSQFPGSGVGLAICQKITERHGGAITASGTPGEGSIFRIYLPVRE